MKLQDLGRNQQHMLVLLAERGGWSPGCGWIWDNRSGTLRILDSLVKRELVERMEYLVYVINDEGRALLRHRKEV